MTIHIDTTSYAGAWRDAIDRGGLGEFRTHGADSAVDDELPSDSQADGFRCEAERVPIHIHSDSDREARHHAA